MTLNDILAAAALPTFVVPPTWGQGRACFGGLVGALLVRRVEQAIPGRTLRALNVSFVGPVAPGPVSIATEILREGKSVTQAMARLTQDDATQAVLLASFGAARPSAIRVAAEPAPAYGPPESQPALPYIPGIVPEFTQHYEFRWHEGPFPFTGQGHGTLGGYMRLREADGVMTLPVLTSLVDAWPPAVIGMFTAPAPASSMTWTMEVVADISNLPAGAWLTYRAQTQHAADGYMHAEARVWDATGRLLVISRQTAVVFA